jgi:DNA-directed RNA polymerase subunit RPC12/RpoP
MTQQVELIRSLSPRRCPACGHAFIPWRVWQISRWSCIRCPHCATRLKRRVDLQLLLISCALFVPVLAVTGDLVAHTLVFWAACMLWASVVLVVDAMTVKLVIAGKWRGLRGYENYDEGRPTGQ